MIGIISSEWIRTSGGRELWDRVPETGTVCAFSNRKPM